jgi:tetratricopeptide (TPR) repeat protein
LALAALHKALIISPDYIPAIIHLSALHLSRIAAGRGEPGDVDLTAGMLEEATRGAGWDVPEAWYLLAKAYEKQGRGDRERECLMFAMELAEDRSVREVGAAVGWCL